MENKRWFQQCSKAFSISFSSPSLSLSLSLSSRTVFLQINHNTQLNCFSYSVLRSTFRQFGAEDQRPFKIGVGSDRIRNRIEFGDLKRREGSVSAIGDGHVGDARTLRLHKRYSQLPEQGAGEASRGQGTRQHTHALQK